MSALSTVSALLSRPVSFRRSEPNLIRASANLRLHPSFAGVPPRPRKCIVGCHVTNAGPSSPEPEDQFEDDPMAGMEENFDEVHDGRDGVQIFFVVLFWMSLLFLSSAWDGSDSGRQRKGSRLRSGINLFCMWPFPIDAKAAFDGTSSTTGPQGARCST